MTDVPKPVIGQALSAGDGNRQAEAHVRQLAEPGDRILRQRGAGDLSLYEQVLSDPQVASCFLQRRNAVTSREWQVDAASDRRIDRKAAEHLRAQLKRIAWDNVTDKMLFGVHYGYSVAELIWDVQDGLYGWSAVRVRNRRRFKFAADGTLRRFSGADVLHGVPAPPPYFWHFATGADHDDEPYGLGLAHWCYWPVLFKRQGLKFWLIFLDKFGMPTAHGQFPSGATDAEKRRLLQACQAMATDSSVVTPEGMSIALIEAARSGTADYKTLHDTMNETIAKVVIGQVASSQGTPGRLGNDDLQGDVRMDIVKADADLVCESFNLGPVQWMTQFNFPGAQAPRVYRVIEEPEDAKDTAERDGAIAGLGFAPSLDYVHETYGSHWSPKQPPAPQPGETTPAAVAPVEAAAFAEGGIGDLEGAIADRLGRDAAPQVRDWLAQIERAVEESADFDALNARLLAEFGELPTAQLTELVGQALVTAHMGARAQVAGEADDARG